MTHVDGSILWLGSMGVEFAESADELRAKLKHRRWVRLVDINGFVKHVRVDAVTIVSDRQSPQAVNHGS
jgi:hypothetical protein